MVRGILLLMVFVMTQIAALHAQDAAPAPAPAAAPQEEPATSSSSSHSSLGFKAMLGVGMPSYEGVDGVTTETAGAWSLGAFWNWSTGGAISFAVQPELHYVYESGLTIAANGNAEVTTTTQSLRLPILAKLEFLTRDVIQPSIYVGPSFSYLLSATDEVNGTKQDIDDPTAFQVGLALGVDVTFLRIFVIDLRYNTKFTKITEVTAGSETVSLSMNSFRAGIGLRF